MSLRIVLWAPPGVVVPFDPSKGRWEWSEGVSVWRPKS